MTKAKLETELHSGYASFRLCGKVSISEDTFPKEDKKSASGWKYRRSSFPVKVGDSNLIYVQMMGGRSSDNPVVYVMNKDNKATTINWDLRNNEEVLENISPRSFMRFYLEKDESGKLVEKRFISEIDAIEYLSEHLKNDEKVKVNGQIEYSHYNGQIQRSFNITSISLAKDDDENYAYIQQTYLADSHAIPRKWEKFLEENGEVKLNLYVPQYISKEDGKEVKQTLALPQVLTIKANGDTERVKKIVDKYFTVDKNVVRELTLQNNVVYGYEKTTGKVKITEELQDLIDLGLMTEEQIQNEATISGEKVNETILDHPIVRMDDNGNTTTLVKDKYAPEALIISASEESEDEVTEESNEDDPFSDEDLFS